jgi:hypothetical protein
VSEELVNRDLDLIMPSPEDRLTLESLYIHLTRIGVIQLDLVAACLKFDENKYQQVRIELESPTCRPLWAYGILTKGTIPIYIQSAGTVGVEMRAKYIGILARQAKTLRRMLDEVRRTNHTAT